MEPIAYNLATSSTFASATPIALSWFHRQCNWIIAIHLPREVRSTLSFMEFCVWCLRWLESDAISNLSVLYIVSLCFRNCHFRCLAKQPNEKAKPARPSFHLSQVRCDLKVSFIFNCSFRCSVLQFVVFSVCMINLL